jgi:hypothetical protein
VSSAGPEEGATPTERPWVERLGPLLAGLEERELRWAALGELDSLVRSDQEGPLPDPVELLVSPYDAPRVQLHLITRGLRVQGEAGPDQVSLLVAGGIHLAVHAHLTRRGWADLPLSPFLEGATPVAFQGIDVRLMEADAAWASALLLLAKDLFDSGGADARLLERITELAAAVDDEARARWDERMTRWGVERAWARARQVMAWLEGGNRPDWLAPGYGEVEGGGTEREAVQSDTRTELALLDRPWGVLRWIALRAVHGMGRLFG